ncbi:MAG: histidine phosphatase family protein, partial [Actinomycetota bacterium]|nr:histidine phosphatase family protein [Actinomycetota bacterium]
MSRTVVHVLRHGEVHNPDGVLYGRIPGYGLSDSGAEMARTVSDYLADLDITHLVSSPLQRAQETAAPIAERLGLPIHTDERLIEPTNVFEGSRFGVGDGSLKRPGNWIHLWNPFRPSWGEAYAEIAARMRAAVQD